MVGKTTTGTILNFEYGDIITTKSPGSYFTLYSTNGNTLTFLFISNNSQPETCKYRNTELNSAMTGVIRWAQLGKDDKKSLQETLKELELPNVNNIFPPNERVNLNSDTVEFDAEEVINKYTKAVLLIEYLEKLVNHLYTTQDRKQDAGIECGGDYAPPSMTLGNIIEQLSTSDGYRYTTNAYGLKISSDDFVDGVPSTGSKKTTKKVRPADKFTSVDPIGENQPLPVSDNSDWSS